MSASPAPRTFGEVLRAQAAARPDKTAFETPDGRSVTFADFERRVHALNNAVAGLGVARGARAAVLAKNCIEYVEVYGLSTTGLIVVPLNWRLAVQELVKLIQHSAPEILVVDAQHRAIIDGVRGLLLSVKHYVLLGHNEGDSDADSEGWIAYERLLADAATQAQTVQAAPDDTLCLIYTSGTTGAPKGVAMTHAGALGNACAAAHELGLTQKDSALAVLPLFHAGGMWYHLFPSFLSGCTTLLLSEFDVGTLLRELEQRRITNIHLAPTMVGALLAHPAAATANLVSLRAIFYAASSMPAELLRRAMQTFSQCGFIQGYGSTEAGVVTVLCADDHQRALQGGAEHLLLSCGRPYPARQVRVVDDRQCALPAGSVGEVQVRSPDLMQGYWLDDAATSRAFQDGWLSTGDLGRFDEEGYLYIVDRKNDLVVTGGENVFPTEVESSLYRLPQVQEAAVFGIPDPVWVEKVVAAVVLRPGAQTTAADIVAQLRHELAAYKCPKEIFFVSSLPKSAVGKVLRKELRKQYGGAEG